ncbi:MAG: YIP1 family protein [Bacillota bacterium]
MTSNRKNILLVVIGILFLFNFTGYGSNLEKTDIPYPSYTYDFWEEPVPAPQAYYPSQIITGEDLGVDSLSDPRDLNISQYTENIYIVDTGNNRIICLDSDWELTKIIDSFENEGQEDTFNNPRGIYVNSDGDMYIADRDNARIVILDEQGELKKIISSPEGETEGVIFEDFRFRPSKVGVDERGRIFVVADEVYEGVMEFDLEGEFVGFFGAPSVTVDPFEYFWRRFSPEERRERLALFLPTEFSNLDIDKKGFVYTTVSGGAVQASHFVRRLNTAGRDILIREGFTAPQGDYGSTLQDASGDYVIPGSVFVDITTRENDIYSVLDRRRGRVFTYDKRGNLLYVFGYDGHLKGGFLYPRAVESKGDKLAVLDSQNNRITVFKPTVYAQKIHQAIDYYSNGYYPRAVDTWQEVLQMNANYDLAYSGIGWGKLFQENFSEAMVNFRRGENRRDYSRAFEFYRRDVVEENLGLAGLVVISVLILLLIFIKFSSQIGRYFHKINEIIEQKVSSKDVEENKIPLFELLYEQFERIIRAFVYGFTIIFHPVGGFWSLKHERKGNVPAATLHLGLLIMTFVFMRQYTGFVFNFRDLTKLNLLVEISSILLPFFLWCIVNWSLTTLMEGKGSFPEIYMTTAYSLIPITVINIPLTVVSNYLTWNEGTFYSFILLLSVSWAFILLFFGTLTIHEYSTTKMLLVTGFIILGIALTMFIGLLFFNLAEQVYGFFNDIYTEIVYRM